VSQRLPVHKFLRTRERTLNPPNLVTGWLRGWFEPVGDHDAIVALVTKLAGATHGPRPGPRADRRYQDARPRSRSYIDEYVWRYNAKTEWQSDVRPAR
jgi:hypothetical protein